MREQIGRRGTPITLENGGAFFMKTDPVHQALVEIGRRLSDEGISYAIIGGMALGYHGYVRVTQDIGLLLDPEGLDKFHRLLVGRGYVPSFTGAMKHFKDVAHGVTVEIINVRRVSWRR